MTTSGQTVGNGRCATRAEVLEAIKALYLSPKDLAKLLGWARRLSAKIPGGANGSAAEDLVQEAIVRTLDFNTSSKLQGNNETSADEPRRKWYPQTHSFLYFLVGCMMSIAYSWRKRDGGQQSVQGSESQQELRSPVNPQAQAEASIILAKIREYFLRNNDSIGLEVFELKKVMGCTGPEIRERLGITMHDYDAASKRIYRALKSEGWK
jgi:hypothetical protein